MIPDLIDYPDPVVASYMDRVRALSPAAQDHLDLHIWRHLLDGSWLTQPSMLFYAPLVLVSAASLIRSAKRSSDVTAAIAYAQFFHELQRKGWTVAGRGRVALGLTVLRCRGVKPAVAFRAYRDRMDAFVPHQSIGWAEPIGPLAE